jgi:hypothetical protein
MAGLILIAVLIVGAALAPRYGVDSRPGFSGNPDPRTPRI